VRGSRCRSFVGKMGSLPAVVSTLECDVDHVSTSPIFGPATDRAGTLTSVFVGTWHEGRVFRAWRVADCGALALSLGLDPAALARGLTVNSPGRGGIPWAFGEVRAAHGQLAPPATPAPLPGLPAGPAHAIATLQAAWNLRRPDLVLDAYAGDARDGAIRGDHPWRRVLTACSDGVLFVEHCVAGEGGDPDECLAVAWRWVGTHDGAGFGEPTGHRLHFRGMSVMTVRQTRITSECIVCDALGTYCDIALRSRPM